jgi:FAD/FMN-containing dehydrogenase/Fe-S oxidoreductase
MSQPPAEPSREIPFNYTSADDRQAISQLLGDEIWHKLEQLRERRVTGRSARLLMRFFGEVLIHRRNAYLYQELIDDRKRRRKLLYNLETDLGIIESNAGGEALVTEVIGACRALLQAVKREVTQAPAERQRILSALGPIVGKENVLFDPFTLVSHATDATDWRLHLPVAVAMPRDEAEVAPLLAAIADLGLFAIPRGAGTGLTGGAVPLRPGCVIVNTEKLCRIRGVTERDFRVSSGARARAHVISVEAGVVTERAIEHAADRGLVFATDPTSAWACTIGGNIAENAGGRTAVLWGTCVDNLVSYQIAMPGGKRFTVRRTNHALRKILPDDDVDFEILGADGSLVEAITLKGSEIRRRGLWKDITNKTLKGLPGLQKEGTDGVITSAEFVLYPQYEARSTLCLEFFGPDMDEASNVIVELSKAFPNRDHEVLQALEHFDDEYVRAIGYKVKAPRGEAPKAVLLIDVVGHSGDEVARGVEKIRTILERHKNTLLFEAKGDAEAKRYWADRKKLGAIAARTNAFKLNEDIVLPLDALAELARFCDDMNVQEERHNQRAFVERVQDLLRTSQRDDDTQWLGEKIEKALERCDGAVAAIGAADPRTLRTLSVTKALRDDLLELVRGYKRLGEDIEAALADERRRLIVLATHMHAGDGNVHVNIPVLSNDRAMMRRAQQAVDRVMERVSALGGVCSGEHGIGVTKLKYLEPEILRELDAYRRKVDPKGTMNPGKLRDAQAIEHLFTPSFNLLKLEARILQHGRLEQLALKIAQCVRCGRCKPNCCVFYPARNLFYHPRGKNLAIGALIEALLYEAQRERSSSFELLRYLEEVADHCTICHKCVKPCPVDIDTGEVSVLEREILVAHGYKHTAMATRATLGYLESRSPTYNAIFRAGVLQIGGALQRTMARVAAPGAHQERASRSYFTSLLRSPIPAADPGTLWDVLPACAPDQTLVFEPMGDAKATVFYFPGCGSERQFSTISMAALHVLIKTGTRVVLPPPYLCCGFPAHANGRTEQHGRIVLRDSVLFTQIREMFAYLDFDAVVVTCGTCREALGVMEASKIFGCDVVDVARWVKDRGLALPGSGSGSYAYHAPCHDSLDGAGTEILATAYGIDATPVPHCCSEAGTLALSRPDIGDAMRHRKSVAITEALAGKEGGVVLLTNCPSCLQGLGRNVKVGATTRHIVVELARRLTGDSWIDVLRTQAASAQAIRF